MGSEAVGTYRATVYGEAESQGSKRIGRTKAGKPIVLDASPRTRSWRQELSREMQRDRPLSPLEGPVVVGIVVFVQRPQSHYGTGRNAGNLKPNAPEHPASGKDLDKVARACLDAAKSIWWKDDRQVCQLSIARVYGAPERVTISVSPVGRTTNEE